MSAIPAVLTGRLSKTLLIVALLLLLLPEAIKLLMIKTMASNGLGEASIVDVDLNLFSGRGAVKGLVLQRDKQHKLSVEKLVVDFSWQRLFRGIFYIEQLELQGTRLAASQGDDGRWEVVMPFTTNEAEPPAQQPESALALPRIGAARLKLADVEIQIDSPLSRGTLLVDRLQIDQMSSWLTESTSLSIAASWNQAPFELEVTASPWIAEPTVEASLLLKAVPLNIVFPLAGGETESLAAQLSMAITVAGTRTEKGDINVELSGELAVEQFVTTYQHLQLNSDNVSWQGSAQLAMGSQGLHYAVSGDLQAGGVQLQDNRQQLLLLGWQQLLLKQLSLDDSLSLSLEQLQFSELDVIREADQPRGRLYTGGLQVSGVQLAQATALEIDSVEVSNGQYQLVLEKDGQLQLQKVLAATLASLAGGDGETADAAVAGSEQAATEQNSAEPVAFTVVLDDFSVQEGSQLSFTDQRFSVPVEQQLNIKKLQLKALDQLQPDQPASLLLSGSLGEFSSIEVNGQLKPFADKLWLEISGQLESIPLPELSPYSEAYMGYHLTRGHYDHRFTLAIANDDIKLENTLKMRKLSLKSVDPDKPQPMARELDLPLGLALDMLRDGDDTIKLEVPIEGRMDNPDVDISKVVNRALATALKSGASSYLTLALQPYGAVFMAAGFIGEQLSAISLQPIAYTDGNAELNNEQLEYVKKIAGMMQQRPQLEMTLCARANELDKAALQLLEPEQPPTEEQLLKLADQRSKQVKRQLLEQGIASKRLFVCQPEYVADAKNVLTMNM